MLTIPEVLSRDTRSNTKTWVNTIPWVNTITLANTKKQHKMGAPWASQRSRRRAGNGVL